MASARAKGLAPLLLVLVYVAGPALASPRRFFSSNYGWGSKVTRARGEVEYINFTSSGLRMGVEALGLFGSRYPGGTPANCFDIATGRLPGTFGFCSKYAKREQEMGSMPTGAYSGASFLSAPIPAPPVWDLNVFSAQVSGIKEQVKYLATLPADQVQIVEMGNEMYLHKYANRFPDGASYTSLLAQVIPFIRSTLPGATIAIIGDWKAMAKVPGWPISSRDADWMNATLEFLQTPAGREVAYLTAHDYSMHGKGLDYTHQPHWTTAEAVWGDSVFQSATATYRAHGIKIPMLFTEFGIPYHQADDSAPWKFILRNVGGMLEAMHWLSYIIGGVTSEGGGMPVAGMFAQPLLEWLPWSSPGSSDARHSTGGGPSGYSYSCSGHNSSAPLLCFNETMEEAPFCSVTSQMFARVAALAKVSSDVSMVGSIGSPSAPTRVAGQVVACVVGGLGLSAWWAAGVGEPLRRPQPPSNPQVGKGGGPGWGWRGGVGDIRLAQAARPLRAVGALPG